MIDLAIAALLLFALGRSIRAGLPVGAALSALAIGHLVFTAVVVLSSLGQGPAAIPFGLFFLGPSALGDLAKGRAHALVRPIATALSTTLFPAATAFVAFRRAKPLHPDTPPALRLVAAGRVAVAASSLSAIRIVTYFLFLALFRD